ncbi:hypothetical protein [Cryobacterium sp. M23]|uniref:hypothetical protein n=1 Tax=Cryobacterium sp. M23 TaxID=2048292 RepID=UPI0018ED5DDD|nr:hypothetical protein [Cryobacterium sp. M23]
MRRDSRELRGPAVNVGVVSQRGGLSLVFAGLLARAIARRGDLRVDYRVLGAAAFRGLGAVWALVLSSSAALLQATAASLPPELLKVSGVLDFGATIFTWQSLVLRAVMMALTVSVTHLSAPRGVAIRLASTSASFRDSR